MKKIALLFTLLFITACGASASNQSETQGSDPNIVTVKEKLFIEQINYIYLNADKYLGKTIKYEGLVDIAYSVDGEPIKYYVIRFGPGCCGDDANAGFEIKTESGEYPEYNDWVAVEGVLSFYDNNGFNALRLENASYEILPERGNEYAS